MDLWSANVNYWKIFPEKLTCSELLMNIINPPTAIFFFVKFHRGTFQLDLTEYININRHKHTNFIIPSSSGTSLIRSLTKSDEKLVIFCHLTTHRKKYKSFLLWLLQVIFHVSDTGSFLMNGNVCGFSACSVTCFLCCNL